MNNLYFNLQLQCFNLHRNNIQLHALIKYTMSITYLFKNLKFSFLEKLQKLHYT